MKRICALLLTAALLTGPAAAAGETAEAAQPALDLSAASAVLMEKETGTLLYEKESHEKLEPASVTKIMTLLLIFEALDSGRITKEDVVTVSAYAAGMGGSQVYLKEGEQMTVGELVKCITVVSGNDAAVAMAEYLAGSETAFVEQMNRRAQELGMGDTTFLNCTGLPAQGHVTSAHDIALMSRELVLNHPSVREYTTIWMDSIRNGAFGLTNTNRLVRFYQGATGLKTGSTDSALYCMSASAERDGMELIAVILKAPTSDQRFSGAQALLNYGFSLYTLVDVTPEQVLPALPVTLGSSDFVQPVLGEGSELLLEKTVAADLSQQVLLPESLKAPIQAGEELGQLLVTSGGETVATIPIVAGESVERLGYGQILVNFLKTAFLMEPFHG